jgi:hypothetical protein
MAIKPLISFPPMTSNGGVISDGVADAIGEAITSTSFLGFREF